MTDRTNKYGEYKGSGGVSLWDLVTFLPLGLALGSAYGYIKTAKLAGIYFWLSLVVGVIIGAICVWFIRALGHFMFKFIGERLNNNARYEDLITRLLYLFAFIWLIISGILGYLGVKFMW